MQCVSANNLGPRGNNLTNLSMWCAVYHVPWDRCENLGTTFWEPAPLKFGRAKNVRIWLDFGQLLTLFVKISGTDDDIDMQKMALSTTFPSTFDEKIWWTCH